MLVNTAGRAAALLLVPLANAQEPFSFETLRARARELATQPFVAPRTDDLPRWLADLPGLARDRLQMAGVTQVSGGTWCTVEERSRFFSFRRDGVTGRMAAAVWIRR